MTVLVLTLAGPLQAWGSSSRFATRGTDDAPTKSGIIGMLAAARGLRRSDPLEDLMGIRFGVRIDQPGELLRDFQAARSLDGRQSMPLSYRYYRTDARYLVGLQADRTLLETLVGALLHPVFPLYLGRRSCPPSEPLAPRLRETSLERVLLDEPWQAATWWRKKLAYDPVSLEFRIDAEGDADPDAGLPLLPGELTARDEPISFDPEHRQYGWRTVRHGWIPLSGGGPPPVESLDHDAMKALG